VRQRIGDALRKVQRLEVADELTFAIGLAGSAFLPLEGSIGLAQHLGNVPVAVLARHDQRQILCR
jgi:hypothetical protein